MNQKFAKSLGITYPLLSDRDGKVGKLYGVHNSETRKNNRANIVIDRSGIIRHIELGSKAIDPSSSLKACRVIQQKE